jgi:outer membrane protein assembly factor BamB
MMMLWPGSEASAEGWPQFRGPTGQGIVREGAVPVTWNASTNVVWKQPIPGRGWSSPIVDKGRIYLTSAVPAEGGALGDQSLLALCLDGTTGRIVWQREVFRQDATTAPAIHGKNSHASPTPLVHGERLYVHFGHQGTACLDLAGNVLWRNTSLSYAPVHGNGGSPVLADGLLMFSGDGGDKRFVAALDITTGRPRWVTPRAGEADRKFSFSTPLVISVAGRDQLVSPGSNSVNAYDVQTGQEVWRVRYEGYSVIPRPVFGHGLVFVCTGFNTPTLLAIRPDGHGDVTDSHVAWTARKGMPLTPSPLLIGEELYTISDNGVASCLDARTGRVHWQERIEGTYSASPIAAGGKVYFLSEQGTTVVIQAGKQFQLVARNPLGERTLASVAAADGALFIRTERHLFRIQAP